MDLITYIRISTIFSLVVFLGSSIAMYRAKKDRLKNIVDDAVIIIGALTISSFLFWPIITISSLVILSITLIQHILSNR